MTNESRQLLIDILSLRGWTPDHMDALAGEILVDLGHDGHRLTTRDLMALLNGETVTDQTRAEVGRACIEALWGHLAAQSADEFSIAVGEILLAADSIGLNGGASLPKLLHCTMGILFQNPFLCDIAEIVRILRGVLPTTKG